MKNLYLIIAILLLSLSVNGQSSISRKDSIVEAFKKYLLKKTKYPVVARENDMQGDVVISFRIGKDKKIDKIKIITGLCAECDSEILLSIRKFPGTLELYSKEYTIGLHYRVLKPDGPPIDSIIPFNPKLYKRFLFEADIIGYATIQKKAITIDVETIHN